MTSDVLVGHASPPKIFTPKGPIKIHIQLGTVLITRAIRVHDSELDVDSALHGVCHRGAFFKWWFPLPCLSQPAKSLVLQQRTELPLDWNPLLQKHWKDFP